MARRKKKRSNKKRKNSRVSSNQNHTNKIYYKYVTSDTLKKILQNRNLKFTNPLDFNDPFDCSYPGYSTSLDLFKIFESLIKKEFKGYFSLKNSNKNQLRKLINSEKKELEIIVQEFLGEIESDWEKFIGLFRILSLTSSRDNILMWSHYADMHQGAVLGFDFSNVPNFANIKKVIYDKDGKKLSNFIDSVIKIFIESALQSNDDFENFLDKCSKKIDKLTYKNPLNLYFISKLAEFFYIKRYEWKYENEYRLVKRKDQIEGEFVEFKKECLKEIILGVRFDEKEILTIKEIVNKNYPNTKILRCRKQNWQLIITEA